MGGPSATSGLTTAAGEASAGESAPSFAEGQTISAPNSRSLSATARNPGIGQAIGFFNLDLLKRNRFAWTLAALAILLAVLFVLGMKGHFHQKVTVEGEDNFGWDSYLERLARQR